MILTHQLTLTRLFFNLICRLVKLSVIRVGFFFFGYSNSTVGRVCLAKVGRVVFDDIRRYLSMAIAAINDFDVSKVLQGSLYLCSCFNSSFRVFEYCTVYTSCGHSHRYVVTVFTKRINSVYSNVRLFGSVRFRVRIDGSKCLSLARPYL